MGTNTIGSVAGVVAERRRGDLSDSSAAMGCAKLDVFYYREARGSFNFDGNQGPWRSDPDLATSKDPLGDQKKSMADFLAGIIAAGSASIAIGDPQRDYFVNSYEGWAQDNWQVSPRLNFNYGVRYTYNGRLHAVGSKPIAIFNPAVASGLSIVGKDIESLYPGDYNNFASIDLDNVAKITMLCPTNGKQYSVDLPEGSKLIHYYDNIIQQPLDGTAIHHRLYCFGYEIQDSETDKIREKKVFTILPTDVVLHGEVDNIEVL